MASEPQSNSGNDFEETPQESSSFGEPPPFKPGSKDVQSDGSNNEKETPPTKNHNWQKRHSTIGIVVNAVLCLLTLATFWVTRDSVSVAKDALEDSRKKDSVAASKQIIIDSFENIERTQRDIKDSLTIDLANRSLQTQITSIKETQKEFEIESRPLVQIVDFNIDSIGIDVNTVAKWNIANLGKFPARILSTKTVFMYDDNRSVEYMKRLKQGNEIIVNFSISNEAKIPITISGVFHNEERFNRYREGKSFFYLFGEYKYESFVTKKRFLYSFIYRISAFPRFNVIVLKSDDKEM